MELHMADPTSITDVISVDPAWLSKWSRAVPRYTSYPTAPQFYPVHESTYREKIREFDLSQKPLSLYIHIPFCKKMCLFCACSVVLNRSPQRQATYLSYLLKEIDLLPFQEKRVVSQLHLGGGTPTSLTEQEFIVLMEALHKKFLLSDDAEISIEVDPRTVYADQGKKLKLLRSLGFNRVSFGVQDLDPVVQEAVRRRQSEEMTLTTYQLARELNFKGINLDLIYGLPFQTEESFARTAEKILELKPDRIAMFSYAKVPWMKIHQKSIREDTLPSTEEKFTIYARTRELFMRGGYTAIGMDHFALPQDPLAIAYKGKKLYRNFQGYALHLADDMLGLGVTAIGYLGNTYFQNEDEISKYQAELEKEKLPIHRGYILKQDDLIRKWVIQSLMCHFELDKAEFKQVFDEDFNQYFAKERVEWEKLKEEKLLEESERKLWPTPMGRLFVRIIASVFDVYKAKGNYSGSI